MASRIVNRRELRKQSDSAEQRAAVAPGGGPADVALKKKKPKSTLAVKRKPRAKKAPLRMCARWGVFDSAMKQVAIFDYNQRAAADEMLAVLMVKKKGTHFLQIVKEPMPEPVAIEAPVPA